MVSGFIPDAREANDYLATISKVKVAVYRVESLPPIEEVKMPRRLRSLLEDNGWELAVRTRDRHQLVWVLYHEHRNTVREIYVVSLDHNELVLVRVEGRLDDLLEKVVEEHGGVSKFLGMKSG
jgi:hypothetical protein